MEPQPARRPPRPARGFTLIEMVVVLFIVGVVISMAAVLTKALTAGQRLSTTTTRLATIDTAIVQFVMQTKRLPCPADGTLASTANTVGTELANAGGGCTTNQAGGVVPWRALGLSETDATDGWNHRFTYRIDPALGNAGAADMSWCDPAGTGALVGTACNTACTSAALGSCTPPATFLLNKGLQVKNVAGTVIMDPTAATPTGAAYVVISPGSTGGGGYTTAGQMSPSVMVDGTQEAKNYGNLAYTAGVSYYVDDSISDVSGLATHFDDIVSRPALLTVINKAGLGPRSH